MLNNYNSPEVAGTPVTFEVLQDGVLIETAAAMLDTAGNYKFETTAEGVVTIKAKAPHWLAQAKSVDLSTAASADFSLTNGDINGDNKINVLDYVILKANYNKVGVTGHAADLNGDSKINVFDYSILKRNYNSIGD